jgi:hypothetical protein
VIAQKNRKALVDKRRNNHTALPGHLNGVPRFTQVLYPSRRADAVNQAVADENRAVLDNSKIGKSGTATKTAGTPEC